MIIVSGSVLTGPGAFAKEKEGEILLEAPQKDRKAPSIENEKKTGTDERKTSPVQGEKYKRKIYIVYILFSLALIYLLITYRKKSRRL
jgi:hypothetical protein